MNSNLNREVTIRQFASARTLAAMTVETKRKQSTIEEFFGRRSKKLKATKKEVTVQIKLNAPSDVESEVKKADLAQQALASSLGDADDLDKKLTMSLSPFLRKLLELEIESIESSWFKHLQEEFRKPYFVKLKQFVSREQKEHTVFPPAQDIYSWSRLTPFDQVKVVIIGQDPYHNHNQAHGLAFSVRPPTPAPPSLKNIYKELKQNYPDFQIDNQRGDLTPWATQGVLLLNTALTVRAHNANSHSKQGWEMFTKKVVEVLVKDREMDGKSLVFLLWGNNAIKMVDSLLSKSSLAHKSNLKVFKSVHPSPLSANRGFFGNNHFKQINDWLYNERKEKMIDWSIVPGSHLGEVVKANSTLSNGGSNETPATSNDSVTS